MNTDQRSSPYDTTPPPPFFLLRPRPNCRDSTPRSHQNSRIYFPFAAATALLVAFLFFFALLPLAFSFSSSPPPLLPSPPPSSPSGVGDSHAERQLGHHDAVFGPGSIRPQRPPRRPPPIQSRVHFQAQVEAVYGQRTIYYFHRRNDTVTSTILSLCYYATRK